MLRKLFEALPALALATLTLVGVGTPGTANGQSFIPIAPLAGGATSSALALSPDGLTVAGQSLDGNNTATPFTWTGVGPAVAFTATGNTTNILPTGVNNSKLVVGNCQLVVTQLPFTYDGANFTTLPLHGTDQSARATGVSDAGYVVANGTGTNVTIQTGYVYALVNGTYVEQVLGGLGAVAGIDNDNSHLFPYLNTTSKLASIYDSDTGNSVNAPTLTGNFTYAEVDAISPNGDFVVGAATSNATAGVTLRQGFLFDNTQSTVALLSPLKPTDVYMSCRAVSDGFGRDQPIAGGSSGTASTFTKESAVIFDTALNATFDLRQLLVNLYSLDLTGWTLNEVHGISEDGLTIIGDGNLNGVRTGFIAKLNFLPENAGNLTIVAQPGNQTVNPNANVTFSVVAVPGMGNSNLTYQWFMNGNTTPIANQTASTLVLTGVQPMTATFSANVSVTNGNGTVVATQPSNVATLKVSGTAPTISPNTTLTLKTNAKLSLTAHAANSTTGYQWSLNGTAITGATNATYVVTKVTSANAGNYTVTAIGASFGNVTSLPEVVAVLNKPSITKQPS